ncbi:zinc-binding alcohol dehydrogenase family protein [Halocella sp. SP3-1]|uniref:zinc-binding alcohol dehydrogenase family protein n=1 Tax=Halocella sp. SP3-1 TaxID=2382161 RepID=UPI000F762818|nr:zinc-binding alcohol dehydrogenase family protein [Halocella sp. SP3-1]AZO93771.1 zinc-binding alcohol dehydrogenase family protein [Halocella sp. SP3-1]MTI58999.1 zinc-binding alcohol dehydrogenase family protein [Bacillota bacterium]
MKGVRIKEPRKVDLIDIQTKEPSKGEALLKVKSAGICGSDIGAFRGANQLVSYPRIIGHEIAGEVLSIPENTRGIKKGDKVIVDPYLYCGHCYPCSIKRTNCCEKLEVLGVHVDGGMVEYFTHPAEMLYKVPDDMEWGLIPLAEPLTIAIHGLHRGRLKEGEHVAINGAGTIGLLAAMAAQYYGAIPILIDLVEDRLEFAKSLGITNVINLLEEDVIEKISKYTDGRRAEMVLEASGANEAIRNTLEMVSYAGRIVFTGWPKKETLLPTDIITKKEIDIRGGRTSVGEFEEAIDLIYNNKIKAKAIITKIISMEDVPETIIDIEENPGDYLKVNVMVS